MSFRCYCGHGTCRIMVSRATMFRHKARRIVENSNARRWDEPNNDDPAAPELDIEHLDSAEYASAEEADIAHMMPESPTLPGWNDRVANVDSPQNDLILGELLLLYFETISTYKLSDAAAKAIYTLMELCLPPDSNSASYQQSKNMLDQIHTQRVIKVDLCPKDCIAYINCKHPKLAHYKHYHRTHCPACGADRKITVNGKTRAAKTGYFLPLGPYLRDCFKQDHMANERSQTDGPTQPPGHVSKSTGWHKKVSGNPRMNIDHRNKALIGMADGIPMFRDYNANSVTPIALRDANLTHAQSIRFRNIHLSGLYPHEFWHKGQDETRWAKTKRAPKTLRPLMYALCDDLLQWEDGQAMTDTSLHLEDPEREFTLRCILLYWCGDYPGLAEATGFTHGQHKRMCHWCEYLAGPKSSGLNRMIYKDYRWSVNTEHDFIHSSNPFLCQYIGFWYRVYGSIIIKPVFYLRNRFVYKIKTGLIT
jgi:hypothetical protein